MANRESLERGTLRKRSEFIKFRNNLFAGKCRPAIAEADAWLQSRWLMSRPALSKLPFLDGSRRT
jgi:hypothetical protein